MRSVIRVARQRTGNFVVWTPAEKRFHVTDWRSWGILVPCWQAEVDLELIAVVDKQFANLLRMVYSAFTRAHMLVASGPSERNPNHDLNPNPNPNLSRENARPKMFCVLTSRFDCEYRRLS